MKRKKGFLMANIATILFAGAVFLLFSVPSHIYYDIRGRKALPVRIGDEHEQRSTGSPHPMQELIRNIDLETRMYVFSEGRGQRITLLESLKILPRPGVKPVQLRL